MSMDKKNLHYAAILFGSTFVIMILAMLFTDFKYPAQSQGTLVFSESFKKGSDIDKIVIENREGTITLASKRDGRIFCQYLFD